MRNTIDSIMARVVQGEGCWTWLGAHGGKDRRPSVTFQGRQQYVYRLTWGWANNKEFPAYLDARHSCDNGSCVNPAHITPGTHAENMRDMAERGRFHVPGLKGDDHPHALPRELVDAVRADYATGNFTKQQVADRHGLSKHTVDKWTKGEVRDLEPMRIRDGRFVGKAVCGERAGVSAHRRRGEPVCAACKQADREYMAAWRAERRDRLRVAS